MSFRIKTALLLFLILCDVILTAIRPGWTSGGTVVRYIACSVHLIVIIMHAVTVFALFSGTIWFAAGLLGQLFFSVKATLPLWIIRFIIFALPWVYNEFASDSTFPWQDWVYAFLSCLDIISVCALGVSLCYTLCCLTDKTMYSPYHTQVGKEERDAVERINNGASPYDNANTTATLAGSGFNGQDPLGGSSAHHTPRMSVSRTPLQGALGRNDSITSMGSASGFGGQPPAAITGFKLPPLAIRRVGGDGGPAAVNDTTATATEMTAVSGVRRRRSGAAATPTAAGRTVTFHGEVETPTGGSMVDNPSFAY